MDFPATSYSVKCNGGQEVRMIVSGGYSQGIVEGENSA